ncbi:MAG TPA: hypothetical protein VLN26_00650 [Gaiellaceae bacterium]|nr:hypothetical protein [Gaiellaceae bacterium]
MRVAEDAAAEQLEVLRQLRLGVEAGAGVVQVDVAACIETREVGAAELVEIDGGAGGNCRDERILAATLDGYTSEYRLRGLRFLCPFFRG